MQQTQQWTEIIRADKRLLNMPLKEVWRYKDLLLMLVKREFVSYYKQTILRPIGLSYSLYSLLLYL